MTTSVEAAFGSHVMTNGFILNNQLTDFSFVPEENGKPVASHTYNDGEIKPAAITPNSASHQQMQAVCRRP
jgi:gamma-glutamyltranspeptidase